MPFIQKRIRISEVTNSLNPCVRFGSRNLFGNRVTHEDEAKKAVAFYIAHAFTNEGSSLFVSDGSSTYYVCLAMTWKSFAFAREFHILTNNLGIASEMEAAPYNPEPKVKIQLLGGEFNPALNATFPAYDDPIVKEQIQRAGLSIVSVRQIFIDEGPTCPEPPSRRVKEYVFQSSSDIIIPLDWHKLADAEPESGKLVFRRREWSEILCNKDRKITIVCDQPIDRSESAVASEIGMRLESDGFAKGTPAWREGTDYDRYCWHAYQFSRLNHVDFIELECSYPEPPVS